MNAWVAATPVFLVGKFGLFPEHWFDAEVAFDSYDEAQSYMAARQWDDERYKIVQVARVARAEIHPL